MNLNLNEKVNELEKRNEIGEQMGQNGAQPVMYLFFIYKLFEILLCRFSNLY